MKCTAYVASLHFLFQFRHPMPENDDKVGIQTDWTYKTLFEYTVS